MSHGSDRVLVSFYSKVYNLDNAHLQKYFFFFCFFFDWLKVHIIVTPFYFSGGYSTKIRISLIYDFNEKNSLKNSYHVFSLKWNVNL